MARTIESENKKLHKVKKKMEAKERRRKRPSYFGAMIDPKGFHPSQIKFYLILLPVLVLTILPILFIVSHAFKPIEELYAYPPKFFASRISFDNFRALVHATSQTDIPFGRYLFNSILVSILVIVISLLLSSLAAFAFTYLNFKGKKFLYAANQLAIMFIAIAVAVPRFMMITYLGIANTYLAHIIPLIAMPVGVFLLKQFMEQIPMSLIEAAKVDGAGEFRIYVQIVMPLVKPAWVTLLILLFQSLWGTSGEQYIYSEDLKMVSYALSQIATAGAARTGTLAAVSLIMILVPIAVFVISQSQVMETMASSGMK